jgi:hypothetical protein
LRTAAADNDGNSTAAEDLGAVVTEEVRMSMQEPPPLSV